MPAVPTIGLMSAFAEGGSDQCSAAWGVSRLWRAAKSIRDGAAHGSHRANCGALSDRNPPPKFSPAGPNHDHRTNHSRRHRSGKFSIARSNFPTTAQRKNASRKKTDRATNQKGMGIAAFLHGAGFTGSGERYLASVVGVEGCADGTVRVLVSSTEFGQGPTPCSAKSQPKLSICPTTMSASRSRIRIKFQTAGRPSRRAQRWSSAVSCARPLWAIKQTLIAGGTLGEQYSPEEFRAACRRHIASTANSGRSRATKPPEGVFWDDQKYRGEAYAAFAWAVYIAEVAVDLSTYTATVEDFVALQEVGKFFTRSRERPNRRRRGAGIGFASTKKLSGKMDACRTAR
jgi:hypothetical protein